MRPVLTRCPGPLTRIDIRGEGGQTFKDKWANGPRSYLGIQTAGFPNFFIAVSTAFCNYTVCAEMVVEWIADCIGHLREKNVASIAPTPEAEEAWLEHSNELAAQTLLSDTKSWFMGRIFPARRVPSSCMPTPSRNIARNVRRPPPTAIRILCCARQEGYGRP